MLQQLYPPAAPAAAGAAAQAAASLAAAAAVQQQQPQQQQQPHAFEKMTGVLMPTLATLQNSFAPDSGPLRGWLGGCARVCASTRARVCACVLCVC